MAQQSNPCEAYTPGSMTPLARPATPRPSALLPAIRPVAIASVKKAVFKLNAVVGNSQKM
jgi:hypothetical protein